MTTTTAAKSGEKLCTLEEAIGQHVPDGASVAMGLQLESMIPFAAGHEIIRQAKRDLTLVGPISDMLFDQIIGAGCVSKVVAAWVGNVMMGSGYNFRRAIAQSIPRPLEMVDHSNFTIALALHAAALGVPFLPTYTAGGSTLFGRNPDLAEMTAPFTAEKIGAVRAIAPDVAIVQAQRADVYGNAHIWGNLGVAPDAARAAKKVIVVAEEIVSPKLIASDPNRTAIPGFLVAAVAAVPFGAHPSPVQGYYNRDNHFYQEYHRQTKTRQDYEAWLGRWVTGAKDHMEYLQRLGADRIQELAVKKHAYAARTDFGH
ncbi:MAG: CoA transferase subunit A [Acidobacteria bacterium]|nr:CoA transferase subunit A [Acidobacteriota bacterium]